MSIYEEKKYEMLEFFHQVMDKFHNAPSMRLPKGVVITREMAYVAWLNDLTPYDFGLENTIYDESIYGVIPYTDVTIEDYEFMPNRTWVYFIEDYDSQIYRVLEQKIDPLGKLIMTNDVEDISDDIYHYWRDYFINICEGAAEAGGWTTGIWNILFQIKLAENEEQNEFYKLMIACFKAGGIPCGWEYEDLANPPEWIDKDKVATEGLQGRKLVVFWPHEQDPEFV